jgi:hypothetical protein
MAQQPVVALVIDQEGGLALTIEFACEEISSGRVRS